LAGRTFPAEHPPPSSSSPKTAATRRGRKLDSIVLGSVIRQPRAFWVPTPGSTASRGKSILFDNATRSPRQVRDHHKGVHIAGIEIGYDHDHAAPAVTDNGVVVIAKAAA
jgi:hypothetical protein